MKHTTKKHLVFAVALVVALPALAQSLATNTTPAVLTDTPPSALTNTTSSALTNTTAPLNLDPPPALLRNRLGLSYRMGFNAPVTFKNVAPVPAPGVARYTLDGQPYNYDNGYVWEDASGNAMGYTRYWGYDNANQVSPDGTILMQRSMSVESGYQADPSDDPMSGVELTYARELIHKKSWHGGLEGAFGYTYMSVHDDATDSAGVTRVYDTYSFPQGGATVVPPSPYTGRLSMPGPVLVAQPIKSTTAVVQDASIAGSRDFSADLLGFRVGPYLEIPVSKSIALTLSGGFAATYVSSHFGYSETVTQGGVSSVSGGSSWHNDWLMGGYVAGNLSVAFSEHWALAAGVQFLDVGQYTHRLSDKEATLDLTKAVFVTIGLTYSF